MKVMDWLKRKWYVPAFAVLLLISMIYVYAVGDEYTARFNVPKDRFGTLNYQVYTEEADGGSVSILEQTEKSGHIYVKVAAGQPGKVYLCVTAEDSASMQVLYIHRTGIITHDDYFGDCKGFRAVQAVFALYFLLLIIYMIVKFRHSHRENKYRYRNILYIGLILFLAFFLHSQIAAAITGGGLVSSLHMAMNTMGLLVTVTFPIVLIVTVLVVISNVKLMRREGVGWRNLLATMLALVLGFGSLVPFFVGMFLQNQRWLDVHKWTGIGRFVEMFTTNVMYSFVAYLECVLFGTIILGIHAAKHIPAFDKDYIIIHGCRIRADGTLTNLLKGRADRAVWFAKQQKEKTGRGIVYVPSGGQGNDEVISEAEAIRRYLSEQGIPEEQIMIEDRSLTTEENMKNAMALIEERGGGNVAFATTNYHVLRAGLLASELGYRLDGIGGKTKSYFWINAFVREFIATVVKEKKRHAIVLGGLVLINLLMCVLMYISNVVLS